MPTPARATPPSRSDPALRPAPVETAPNPAGAGLLFLREEQLRLAQDMIFFAYRDLTGAADAVLDELGLGRAHHRVLHFVGSRPELTVSELLGLLRITKQSLARVLGALIARGYVLQARGARDRRQRRLSLTEAGRALERRLFEAQRERLVAAYREAGGPAVEGFRRVLRGLMETDTRGLVEPEPNRDARR
nr:MarR family transcriptional regulator [Endobacter medicaginis]